MPLIRRIGSMCTITIQGVRPQPGNIAMPDRAGAFWQRDLGHLGLAIMGKNAKIDCRRVLGKDREICTLAVMARTKQLRATGFDFKFHRVSERSGYDAHRSVYSL